MYNIYSSGKTHKGDKKQQNEDTYFMDNKNHIWCINDGVGGYKNGKFASDFLKSQIQEIDFNSMSFEEKQENLLNTLENTNRILYSLSQTSGRLGTTNTSLLINENYAMCAWVGDSRCYLKRENHLYILSKDHALIENNISKGIMRAVGADENILIDKFIFKIKLGDIILLCTDGIYNIINDNDLFKSMIYQDSEKILDNIFQQAKQKYRYDNLTAIIITINN